MERALWDLVGARTRAGVLLWRGVSLLLAAFVALVLASFLLGTAAYGLGWPGGKGIEAAAVAGFAALLAVFSWRWSGRAAKAYLTRNLRRV